MLLKYLSHSSFIIQTGQKRIVFDPWFTGSAYQDQWFLFPQAVQSELAEQADIVLISHGHEDHFHHASLKKINKEARIYFPFQWRAGVKGYLNHIGFDEVTEAVSFKTYQEDDIRITYVGYSLESVIVVECEGQVIVNINDALNSNHKTAVHALLKKIKTRWPHIDFFLSGWSGAGYFPNKVNYKGKNDVEVARIREEYYADNFCRFANYLQPEIAIPFAPGFVLLHEENRWINHIKFPRQQLDKYYRDNYESKPEMKFLILYPGDYLDNKSFHAVSSYHNYKDESVMYNELDELFRSEIAKVNKVDFMEDSEVDSLVVALQFWINKNKSLYHERVIRDCYFSIKFTDVEGKPFVNIIPVGTGLQAIRSEFPQEEDRLLITTRAELVAKNLQKPWGGDLLSIGYGVSVDVYEELSLEKNLDIVAVRLISRYPIYRDDLLKYTGRMVKYYTANPSLTSLWLMQKLRLKPYVNKYPYNERDHWISYNKCELCKVCNIPQLDFEEIYPSELSGEERVSAS